MQQRYEELPEEILEVDFLHNYKIIQRVCHYYTSNRIRIPTNVWNAVMKIRKKQQHYEHCSTKSWFIRSLKKTIKILQMWEFIEMQSLISKRI